VVAGRGIIAILDILVLTRQPASRSVAGADADADACGGGCGGGPRMREQRERGMSRVVQIAYQVAHVRMRRQPYPSLRCNRYHIPRHVLHYC
jgi:hypothetical protein